MQIYIVNVVGSECGAHAGLGLACLPRCNRTRQRCEIMTGRCSLLEKWTWTHTAPAGVKICKFVFVSHSQGLPCCCFCNCCVKFPDRPLNGVLPVKILTAGHSLDLIAACVHHHSVVAFIMNL
jgi:hypothetical protein